MNDIQKRLFNLLIEVKELCEKNNIQYFLNYQLLYDAIHYGKVSENKNEFSIIIKEDDVNKFIEAANKNKDRVVDYLKVSPNFPGTYLKYVDKKTMYYDAEHGESFKHPGFAIKIEVLRYASKSKFSKFYNDVLESGIEVLNGFSFGGSKQSIMCAGFVMALGIFGRKNRANYIYKRLTKVKNKNKKYLYYKPFLKKKIKFNKNIFDETKTIKIENIEFTIPKNEEYLKVLDGYTNDTIKIDYNKKYIIDEKISYQEFFHAIRRKKIRVTVSPFMKFLVLLKSIKIRKYRLYVKKCWELLYRTRDRYELLEYYEDKKDEILKLYSKKEYKKLEKILEKYIECMESYASKKLGIIFDPVIFEITIETLVNLGKMDYAKKYIKLAPKEYFIPMKEDIDSLC